MFWFKDKICPTRILVCCIGEEPSIKAAFDTDLSIYLKYYPHAIGKLLPDGKSLAELIRTGNFDAIHIIGRVDIQGDVSGIHINELHYFYAKNKIKLVFWAFNNDKEIYINYFKPTCFNLVFTLDRRGQYFVNFLDRILTLMAGGKNILQAWIRIAPQRPKAIEHETGPTCLLRPGSPNTIFLP